MSAPGQAHRNGITLVDLIRMFPDDATAEAFFADERWPNGVACPRCGSVSVQSGAAHKTMPYRCRDCRKRFSVKTGNGDGRLEPRVPDVGARVLPAHHEPQGREQHEAPPRPRDHAEVRVAPRAPPARSMG